MIRYTLKDLFDECNKNKIFINLDYRLIYTDNINIKYNKNDFIGILNSLTTDINEIIESLKEEGSADVRYLFINTSKTLNDVNVKLLLHSIFKKFNFEPYIKRINRTKKYEIDLVISKNDLTDDYKNEVDFKSDNNSSLEDIVKSLNKDDLENYDIYNTQDEKESDEDSDDSILNSDYEEEEIDEEKNEEEENEEEEINNDKEENDEEESDKEEENEEEENEEEENEENEENVESEEDVESEEEIKDVL